MPVDAILFDKDGTLFDFGATWNVWARRVIDELAEGDAALTRAMAAAVRFDLDRNSFLPDSPVIAGTNREAAEYLASALPHRRVEEIEAHLARSAAEAPLAPAVPLAEFLDALAARGRQARGDDQ